MKNESESELSAERLARSVSSLAKAEVQLVREQLCQAVRDFRKVAIALAIGSILLAVATTIFLIGVFAVDPDRMKIAFGTSGALIVASISCAVIAKKLSPQKRLQATKNHVKTEMRDLKEEVA